jgi:hypothetical protein
MGRRATPQLLGRLVGLLFLVIGVLGFVPGVTRHRAELEIWKEDSGAELFGAFRVSIVHNALHIGFGILGLVASRTAIGARLYLIWGAIGFFTLWVYGAATDLQSRGNVLPVNEADNWLHLGLSLAMLALAWIAAGADRPVPVDPETAALGEVEHRLQEGSRDEALPGLAWLAARELPLEEEVLRGPRRRAVLLLAAGGDPLRGLSMDGRAVTSLAAELEDALPAGRLEERLERLRPAANGFPLVSSALTELSADSALAYRALACALLAEELDPE